MEYEEVKKCLNSYDSLTSEQSDEILGFIDNLLGEIETKTKRIEHWKFVAFEACKALSTPKRKIPND